LAIKLLHLAVVALGDEISGEWAGDFGECFVHGTQADGFLHLAGGPLDVVAVSPLVFVGNGHLDPLMLGHIDGFERAKDTVFIDDIKSFAHRRSSLSFALV
jgi:hypothetical protein